VPHSTQQMKIIPAVLTTIHMMSNYSLRQLVQTHKHAADRADRASNLTGRQLIRQVAGQVDLLGRP
jgi:hypothetical protein